MNPEFQRNIWFECTPRRVVFLLVCVALVLLAGHSSLGEEGLRNAAKYIFYGLTIAWGARYAATTVIGEMRERTWDIQRMSAISPFAMTWGKLLGSTSYAWIGGAICLFVLFFTAFREAGPIAAVADFFYFVSLALMAHTVALFSSLLAARRRQAHSRLDVFFFQALGIAAAWCVWTAWKFVVDGELSDGFSTDNFEWWGMQINQAVFYAASIVAFLGWAIIGCYRVMRRELSVENSPKVWVAFLVFMVIYCAGHADTDIIRALDDDEPLPFLYAMLTLASLTYIAVFVEPKDHVLYRWLAEAFAARRFHELYSRMQAWMISYVAALAAGLVLIVVIAVDLDGFPGRDWRGVGVVLAALGLLTRDIGIFLLFAVMSGAKRGDYAAGITLGVLYGIAPSLFSPFGGHALFYPVNPELGVLGPLVAWGEALGVWYAVYRIGKKNILEKRVSPPAGAVVA
jgi:hypothetical protein